MKLFQIIVQQRKKLLIIEKLKNHYALKWTFKCSVIIYYVFQEKRTCYSGMSERSRFSCIQYVHLQSVCHMT
jgi:hypothetical protein